VSKTKITLATIGHMPAEFNRQKVKQWESSIFEIIGDIESYALKKDSDGENWEYSDASLESVLPDEFSSDFLICIVNVPLELNWYSRRLSSNRVVFTFHEIKEYLKYSNIPLENVVLRLLNSYTLLYKRSNNSIPTNTSHTSYTHDETRGCLFDMNGFKVDIIYSCHNPIICEECIERLRSEKVSEEIISKCKTDIKKIHKTLFYRITDFIKLHPLWSMLFSMLIAITLNVIASCIYEVIK
jgi:hypothetical protein